MPMVLSLTPTGGDGHGEQESEEVGDDATASTHDLPAGVGSQSGQRDVRAGFPHFLCP
jgi:hypothetical protein